MNTDKNERNSEHVVYLLVGPRGSGKTSYIARLMERDPDLKTVSRDDILVEACGTTSPDSYSGAHIFALEEGLNRLKEIIKSGPKTKTIYDHWTGTNGERWRLIRHLRDAGATRIIALYFLTPVEYVKQWFWQKPGIAPFSKMREIQEQGEKGFAFYPNDAPEQDHALFHEYAAGIDSDGFDQVIRVNPLDELVVLS